MGKINGVAVILSAIILSLVTSAPITAAPSQADMVGFQQNIQPLLKKLCVDCHGADDPEGKLSLHAINPDMLKGDVLETWRLVEERVRFREMPPKDSEQPTAAEKKILLDWVRNELLKTQLPGVITDEKLQLPQFGNYVDHQSLFGERRSRVIPSPPRVWRVRPEIYESQMRNTRLAEGSDPLANGLTIDDGSEFKDYAAPYFIDEAGTSPLLGNAKKLAAAMLSQKRGKNADLKRLTSDNEPPNLQTVEKAIHVVFRQALGRRPSVEELKRFAAFYEKSKAIGDSKIAAHALVTAILMQPEFFFRTELGDGNRDPHGRFRLSQMEIAYALSYALDNEPVDDFLSAAREGRLATADQVAEVVRQQLGNGTPRIPTFFREYFHYPFATEVFKDPPEGAEHSPDALIGDLEMTIRPILKSDRNVLAQLLTTREFYVNATYKEDKKTRERHLEPRNTKTRKYQTAFNLPIDWKWSADRQPVAFPKNERAGVLTHPAWLAAWSGNFENHPVQRGKWIRTHLLGGTVPDVPIGVDARVPEMDHTTFRERLRIATQKAECWRCHQKMDPLGVPFERYDHYGRLQRLDAGQPVETTGRIDRTGIAELDGTNVSGPTEMMEILAKSEHVEQVFVRHAFRFFLGRNETLGDANTLQDAHKAYRENDGSFQALVISLLSSESFLFREIPQ